MTAGLAPMSAMEPTERPLGATRVLFATVLASLAAGATGLAMVFGPGLLELPWVAVPGFVYAVVPGTIVLATIHWLLSARNLSAWCSLAAYVSAAALMAVLWFLPFMGLYVPIDRPDAPAAIAGMALYHAVSGAVGGLVFWLLTRRWQQT